MVKYFLRLRDSLSVKHDGEWCNGSTYDSDSYCQGSNPCSPANLPPLSRGLGRRPLKAETWVRIPLGVPPIDANLDSGLAFSNAKTSLIFRVFRASSVREQTAGAGIIRDFFFFSSQTVCPFPSANSAFRLGTGLLPFKARPVSISRILRTM